MRISLFVFIFLLMQCAGMAQVRFTATTNVEEVKVGDIFDIYFTLENLNTNKAIYPKFGSLKKLNGPKYEDLSHTTMVNGTITNVFRKSYIYTLKATKPGKTTIPEVTIKVNGQQYKSNALTINVRKDNPNKIDNSVKGQEVFIKAIIDSTSFHPGQQIIVDYKLFTSIDISSYKVFRESGYDGFIAKIVKNFNSSIGSEKINGKEYTTKILKRVALFPQQSGTFTIESMGAQLGIPTGQTTKDIFGRPQRQTVARNMSANPLTIKVVSTPLGAPASFSGAIGNFDVKFKVNRSSLSTDDALEVTLDIFGNGDIKRLQAPDIQIPESDFETYDPKTIDEQTGENGGQMKFRKIYQYVMLPKRAGRITLSPEFSYYSPDSSKYITVRPDREFVLNIQQGSNTQNIKDDIDLVEQEADIRPIHTSTTLTNSKPSLVGSSLLWALMGLPFLLLGSAFVYRYQQDQKANIDPELIKSQRATKVALAKLSQAQKHLDNNDARNFYDEVSRASLGYVGDKLKIQGSQMTKSNVKEKLQSLGASPVNIVAFDELLKTCEMALFAGQANESAMKANFEKAKETISGIEKEIG